MPPDVEIWAANEMYQALGPRKPDRVFQMHVRDWREAERVYLNNGRLPAGHDPDCFGRDHEHVDYLRTCGVPVYMQRDWSSEIPTCVVYPFEQVTEAVGIWLPPHGNKRLWATSTFGYMMALLLTEHLGSGPPPENNIENWLDRLAKAAVSEIMLYGIELPLGTQRERLWEWPNLAYYLGLATGLRINVTLPQVGSSLLSAPHYALDGRPEPGDPDHWNYQGYPAVVYDDDAAYYRLGTYKAEERSE